MARKSSAAKSDTSFFPSLDSLEFDDMAREWIEELIRRAKAEAQSKSEETQDRKSTRLNSSHQ